MKASKLVYNNYNYISVSGVAQIGVAYTIDKGKKYFGLEEWNNSETFRNIKLGYLDSFRSNNIEDVIDFILLFSYNPNDKQIYLIGCMKNVKQIKCNEIDEIRNQLAGQNWLNSIQNEFQNINDNGLGFKKYKNCWNSNYIVEKTEESFIVNVRYVESIILEEQINLTEIFPNINNLKRLSVLYNLPIEIQEFVLKYGQ